MDTDEAYMRWLHAVGLYTLSEWGLVPQECDTPWHDLYDQCMTPEVAFARAQQEHEAVKAIA
jgi:hypothetical protein